MNIINNIIQYLTPHSSSLRGLGGVRPSLRKVFGGVLLLFCLSANASTLPALLSALEDKTLRSDFTITVTDDQSQPMTYSGTLTMHGRQFLLSMWAIETAYDGQTFYMYSADSEELTLSTPTEEELLQTNPFLYAKALVPVCKVDEKVLSGKGQTLITLTPNDPSAGIARFVFKVETATLLPLSVELRETTGRTTSLRLTNPAYITDPQSFTIEKPDAFLNDLR